MRLTKQGRVYNFVRRKIDNFRWGGLNDFFNEIYITMCFTVCINLTELEFREIGIVINNVFALAIGVAIVIVPVYVSIRLFMKWKNLPSEGEQYLEDDQKEGG